MEIDFEKPENDNDMSQNKVLIKVSACAFQYCSINRSHTKILKAKVPKPPYNGQSKNKVSRISKCDHSKYNDQDQARSLNSSVSKIN